jgi:hypothetical protein
VEAENHTATETVNWKVCKSAITLYCLYLSVIKMDCSQSANKAIHPK